MKIIWLRIKRRIQECVGEWVYQFVRERAIRDAQIQDHWFEVYRTTHPLRDE